MLLCYTYIGHTVLLLFTYFFHRKEVKEVPSFTHFILNRKEKKKRKKFLHQSMKERVM
jgi:hypothetical protein